MVSLIWYMMMMMMLMCEKEVFLLCAGSECERFIRERVVRGTKALSFFNFRVSLHRSLLQINQWTASLWLVLAFLERLHI